MRVKSSAGIENFLYLVYLITIGFSIKIYVQVYPKESYKNYIKELPTEEGGRFSEGPTFLLVLYTGIGVVFAMFVIFTIYV